MATNTYFSPTPDSYISDIKAAAASGALTTDDAVSLIAMVQAAEASNKLSASLSKQARKWQTARADKIMAEQAAPPAMIVHVNVRTAWESGSPEACAAEILRLIKQGRAGVKAPEPVDLAAHWTAVLAETPMSTLAAAVAAAKEAVMQSTAAVKRSKEAQDELIRTIEVFGSPVSDSERHARAALAEAGIANPSTALLRARLMLDHAKEARDLAHGWPGMLGVHGQTDLISALDCAETIAMAAYRHLLTKERLSA